MSHYAAVTAIIFDPHAVLDPALQDAPVDVSPLTLVQGGPDDNYVPAPFVVVTTMLNTLSGEHWYFVSYHASRGSALEDFKGEQESVRLCNDGRREHYGDLPINTAFLIV